MKLKKIENAIVHCKTQEEAEAVKRCEELAKSQKTKQYTRYERVCRVKGVE